MRTKLFAGIVIFILLFSVSPVFSEQKSSVEEFQKSQKTLSGLLPDFKKMGAEVSSEPKFYNAENLYEYIDGAADAFIQYDFRCLANVSVKKGEIESTIDIYDMGTDLNAFGIYSAERSPEYSFATIGIQGVISDEGLNFVQKQYYTKISAFGPKEKTKPWLEELSKALSGKIGEVNAFPKEFGELFPKENLIKNSEKYIKSGALGLSFLANSYFASYKTGEEESVLSISISPNTDKAKSWIASMKEHSEKMRSTVSPVQNLADEAYQSESKYEGRSLILRKGKFFVYLNKPPQDYKKMVDAILKNIPDEKTSVSK